MAWARAAVGLFSPLGGLALLVLLGGGCARFGFGLAAADGADRGAADAAADLDRDGAADDAGEGPSPDGPLPSGAHLWSRRLGHAGAVKSTVATVDEDGNTYVAGGFVGRVNLGGADLTAAGDTDLYIASYDAAGAHRWSRRYGDLSEEVANGLAIDAAGALFACGQFRGTTSVGGAQLTSAGNLDVLVASFDSASGAHRWSRGFGGGGHDQGSVLAVDGAGRLSVAGTFAETIDLGGNALTSAGSMDVFVAGFAAADGAHRWSRGFGGSEVDVARGLAVDGDGNVTVAGFFRGSVDLGGGALTSAGHADIYLGSYGGEDGSHRWSARYGGTGDDAAYGVAVDGAGAIYVSGKFQGTVDLGGGGLSGAGNYRSFLASYAGDDGAHRWSRAFSGGGYVGNDVAVGPGGSVLIGGYYQGTVDLGGGALVSAGAQDASLASYDGASGAHRWSRRVGGSGADRAFHLAVGPDGDARLVGRFERAFDLDGTIHTPSGGEDALLAIFDGASGARSWSRAFAGVGHDSAQAAAVDADGNLYVGGAFEGRVDLGGGALAGGGGYELFVASYDAAGAHRWSRAFGGADDNWALGVALSPGGDLLVTGTSDGPLDLGGGTLSGDGSRDVFVASFRQSDGAHRWSRLLVGPGNDVGRGVAVDASGNIYVIGAFWDTLDCGGDALTSAGKGDVFLASYAPDGAPRWSRGLGGDGNDTGAAVAVTPGGDVCGAGAFDAPGDFGGGALTPAGSADVFIGCYDGEGAHRWSKGLGGSGYDAAGAIAVDAGARVTVTGRFEQSLDFGGGPLTSAGAADVFVASYDAGGGEHLWSDSFGGITDDHGDGIAVAADGAVVVVGYFGSTIVEPGGTELTSAGGGDLVVVSYAADRTHRWTQRFGGRGDDWGTGVAAGPSAVVLCGRFVGAIDFGGGPLPGVQPGFVAALVP